MKDRNTSILEGIFSGSVALKTNLLMMNQGNNITPLSPFSNVCFSPRYDCLVTLVMSNVDRFIRV